MSVISTGGSVTAPALRSPPHAEAKSFFAVTEHPALRRVPSAVSRALADSGVQPAKAAADEAPERSRSGGRRPPINH